MAYDSAAGVTVMYGGMTADGVPLHDTWLWSGTSWSPAANHPSPRVSSPSLTDDPADGGVLLVGGGGGAAVDPGCVGFVCAGPDAVRLTSQTWLFHAGTWRMLPSAGDEPPVPLTLVTTPTASGIVAVADVAGRDCTTGGQMCRLTPTSCIASGVGAGCLDTIPVSTWSWSDQHWTALQEVVDVGSGLVLVPSSDGSTLELLSASAPASPPCLGAGVICAVAVASSPRSWRWSGGGWSADDVASALPPLEPGLVAIDGSRSAVLETDGAAWILGPVGWQAVAATAPAAVRYGAAMAADRNGRWVLFGGGAGPSEATDNTWLLTPAGWRQVSATSPATPA